MKFALRICLILSGVGFSAGCVLFIVSCFITPDVAASFRLRVVQWFGGYIMITGSIYVLLIGQVTKQLSRKEPESGLYSHCPPRLRIAGYALMILGMSAFITAIVLIDRHSIDQFVGEGVALSAFSITTFAGLFCQLWSTLSAREKMKPQ